MAKNIIKPVYVFMRAEGFYPLHFANDAEAKSNAAINPGTLKVIRMYPFPETTIWDATVLDLP